MQGKKITRVSKDLFLNFFENYAIKHILNVHLLSHSQLFVPGDSAVGWEGVPAASFPCSLQAHWAAVQGQNIALNWRQMPAMGIAKSFQALQEALGSSGRCFQ